MVAFQMTDEISISNSVAKMPVKFQNDGFETSRDFAVRRSLSE